MFCYKCGVKLPQGSRFCPRCGAAVPEVGTAKGEEATRSVAIRRIIALRKKFVPKAVVILVPGALDEMRLDRPGWERVDAVKNGRVYQIGEITPLTVFDWLEEISRLLHPIMPTR